MFAVVCLAAFAACKGGRPTSPTDNRSAVGGACLPADAVPPAVAASTSDEGEEDLPPPPPDYRLTTAGGRAHVCRSEYVKDEGTWRRTACWAVALDTGELAAGAVVEEPGFGRRTPATRTPAGLCAGGYCVPVPADDDVQPTSDVDLAVGAQAAVVLGSDSDRFDLFGADRRARPVVWFDETRDDGPSAAMGDALVVGDVVFIGDHDAGPHADVHMWKADGTSLGVVRAPGARDYEGDYERYGGTISLLSEHQVAFAELLLQRVLVVDTRTLKTTVWKRTLPAVAGCTDDNVRLYFSPVDGETEWAIEEGAMTRACLDGLRAAHARFEGGSVAMTGDGALVTLARDARGVALVHFDDRGGVAREVAIPICAH